MKFCKLPCILLAFAVCLFATQVVASEQYYFAADEVLDSGTLLPAPPQEGSTLFANDKAKYEEGLSLRQTPRGDIAAADADQKKVHEAFAEAFGHPISAEKTPALYALVNRVGRECRRATHAAKRLHSRIRPYVMYKANTCFRKTEDVLRNTGSYPSGHSSNGWGVALVLAEINPARKDALFARGYEYGQSRVICGYHWQSDVDAARLIASACVAMLHANPHFVDDLNKAREEFAKLRF